MKLGRKSAVLFVVILVSLLGGALRIYRLDRESLWLDEGASVKVARMDLVPLLRQSAVESYSPFYNTLLHFWIKAFGDSAESVRMMSVLFGALAIFAIFVAGREWFGAETGLLSCLLLSCSAFNVRYSQEARGYTLALFLTLLSYYFFRRMERIGNGPEKASGPGKLAPLAYLAINILLVFSHPYGVFIILAQNLYFFSLKVLAPGRISWPVRNWLLVQTPLLVVTLAWVLVMAYTSRKNPGVFWIPRPDLMSLFITLWYQAGSRQLILLFGLLVILSLLTVGPRKVTPGPGPGPVFAVLLWLIVPVLAPFVFSLWFTPIFHFRYTILASPALCLLAAQGIGNLHYRVLKWPVAALAIALSLISTKEYFSTFHKAQWREAVDFLEHRALPGDILIFHQGYTICNIYDYYAKRKDLAKVPFPDLEGEIDAENISKLDQLIQGRDRVWVVISYSQGDELLLFKKLEQSYSNIYQKTFVGIDVYMCEN